MNLNVLSLAGRLSTLNQFGSMDSQEACTGLYRFPSVGTSFSLLTSVSTLEYFLQKRDTRVQIRHPEPFRRNTLLWPSEIHDMMMLDVLVGTRPSLLPGGFRIHLIVRLGSK